MYYMIRNNVILSYTCIYMKFLNKLTYVIIVAVKS